MKSLKITLIAGLLTFFLVSLKFYESDNSKSQNAQLPQRDRVIETPVPSLIAQSSPVNKAVAVDDWSAAITEKVLDSHLELRLDGTGWDQISVIQTNRSKKWLRVESQFIWNDAKNDYVPSKIHYAIANEILVKLDNEMKLSIARRLSETGLFEIDERLSDSGWFRVKLTNFQRVSDLPKALKLFRKEAEENISAEPDYLVRQTDTFPDDIELPWQYYLKADLGINALAGWDLQSNAGDIKVAVIDSGIQASHEDLQDNLWTNPEETLDGIDNDNNGYVDDTFGVDIIAGLGNPGDESGHGTQVSGLIGATGNNGIGISGVAWKTQLMVVRILNEEGIGTISDALMGIQYAIDNKADILNLSWGGSGRSQALEDILIQCNEEGILCVTAAGNSGVNIDSNFEYPASFHLPNLITVGAIGDALKRASFSNWGPISVDIMAPGVSLASTHIDEAVKYQEFTGTSAAAPLVSGVAALAKARFGEATPAALKSRILLSARLYDGLGGIAGTGGIVDLKRVLNEETNAPPNDDFADALGIAGSSASFQNSLRLGSIEPGEPDPQNFQNAKSLWFSVIRDMDTSLAIKLSGDDPSTALNVYTGDSPNSLMLVRSILTSERAVLRFEALKDTVYYLQIIGSGSAGIFSLQLDSLPANDDFAKARQLGGGTFAVSAKNTNATFEAGEPEVSNRSIGKSLWWKFSPDRSGTFYISTFGSETDTVLGIYQGSGFSNLNLLSFNDDQSDQLFTSALSLEVTQGDSYFIQIDSGYNPGGFVSLSGQFLNAPIFLQTPQSRSATIGDQVIFQGLASGPEPLGYEWRKDGQIIAFQNRPNLVINSVSEEHFGVYQLEVSSPGGSILSTEAILSRQAEPLKILIQPEPLFLNEGEAGKLGVLVSDGTNVTYSWYRNFQKIPGSNANQINVGSGGFETGLYFVEISLGNRTLRSNAVWVSPNHGEGKLGTRVTASKEDKDLTVIEFFNDQFIAADRKGRYKLSDDGFTWTGYVDMENGLPAFASAIGNGKLVFAQDGGNFAVTSDLENWDFSKPDPEAEGIGFFNKDLVFHNGYFFTWIGAGKVLKSVDGLEWTTSLDLGGESNVRSVSAAAGIVLAVEVAGNSLRMHRSSNGVDWTSQDHPELQASSYSKAVGGVDFFILTADRRYVSFDGVNWTVQETPPYTDQIRKILKVGNTYYAALEDSVIMHSSDGLEWETVFEGIAYANEWAGFAFGKGIFLIGPVDDSIVPIADFNDIIHSVREFSVEGGRMQYLDNQFFIPSDSLILTSKTGAIWEKQQYDPDLYVGGIESIAYGNGIYTLGSASGPALDQLTFRENNMQLGPRPLVFEKDVFIGTGMVWSANGIDWNTISLELSSNIRDVIYENDRFVGVGYDEATGYSLDGKNWFKAEVVQNGQFFEADFTSVAFGNGKFVAPVYDMDRIGIYESEDGTTWSFVPSSLTEITPDPEFPFNQGDIAFWNGKFYISAGDSIYVSENLTTWDEQESIYYCNGFTATPDALFGVGRDGVFRIGEQPGRPPTLVFKVPGQIIAQEGETIEIEVDAFDLDGSISSVTFSVDGDLIREIQESPYRFSLTVPDWGSYAIKATAVDSSGISSSIAKIVRATKRSSIPLQPDQLSVRESNATTFNNSGYLLAHSGTLYRRDAAGNWQIAYQFPSGDFISLQVFKNVLLANSNLGVYSTTDGVNWNFHEVPNENHSPLYQYDDVVVSGYNSNVRYVSVDGLNWRKISLSGLQFFDSIIGAYNGSVIARSYRDGEYLIEDADGEWFERQLPEGKKLEGVVSSEKELIIWVYDDNTPKNRYFRSSNLSDWQEFFPPYVQIGGGAFFANEIFVVYGSTGGSYTNDFVNWNKLPDSGLAFDIIRFGNVLYLATDRGVYNSENGLDWHAVGGQARSESRFRAVGNTLYLVDSFGARETTDGVTWTHHERIDSGAYESELLSLTYGNSGYIGLTPEFIARSQDGLSWQFDDKPAFLENSIAFGKGMYVSNTASREIATSLDGMEWELNNIVNGGVYWNPQSIHYLEGAGLFLIDNQNFYFTSPDGFEWTIRNFNEYYRGNFKKAGGLIFGAVRPPLLKKEDITTYVTSDGINWKPLPGVAGSVFFQNEIFLAAGRYVDTPLLKSENGIDWIPISTPVSGIGTPQYIDEKGIYVAFGDSPYYKQFFFTEDGEHWIELPPFDWMGQVFTVNDRILYSYPQLQLATSDDLRLSNITLSGGSFGVGDLIDVSLNVTNLGNHDVDLMGVEVWSALVKKEGWDGSKPLVPAILSGIVINAGASIDVPVAIEIPQGTTPGRYGLQVWLNPTQVYPETTVQNNYAWSGGIQVNIPVVDLDIQSTPGGSVFSVPAKNDYAMGESVSLVAVALPKFRVKQWEGVDFANGESAIITLHGDKSVRAEFTRVYYPEITTIGGGKVYIQPEKPYFLSGDTITVSAVADDNWTFNGWSEPLNGLNTTESFEIHSDIILAAKFGQTIENWKSSTFTAEDLNDAGISGATADADLDGFNTVMEFHFGTDPLDTTDFPRFELVNEGNTLSFFFEQSITANGFELSVENSSDLVSWGPVSSNIKFLGESENVLFAQLSLDHTNVVGEFFRLRLVENEN